MSYSIVDHIIVEDFETAKEKFSKRLAEILDKKLETFKHQIALRDFPVASEQLQEYMTNVVQRRGRLKLIRIRIYHGKVQRRKKLSAVKGYTFRHNHLIRMRPIERLHRRLAARRAKIKRRTKHAIILRKTRIAMRKRRSLGLRAWGVHQNR